MFNGIIEEMGQIVKISKEATLHKIFVKLKSKKILKKITPGSSVSINGTCLSVETKRKNIVRFSVIKETLNKTNLGLLEKGDFVNIDIPLTLQTLISGHLILGHIDCTGLIKKIINISKGQKEMWIEVPKKFSKYLLYKGSIAIDGISLTISAVKGNLFKVSLIPLTLKKTNLQYRKENDKVNLEFDYIIKIVKGRI
jgi:riboflavin synthase